MNRLVALAFALTGLLPAQNPIQVVTTVSGVTGHTIVQSIYHPTPAIAVQAFVSSTLLSLGMADIFFGAYSCNVGPNAGVGLARDQWGVLAVGGFAQGATDFFVADPVFVFFPPNDYSTINTGFRRGGSCTSVPVDTIYSAGLLIGYLPLGTDVAVQAAFLTPSIPLISDAVRIQVN
jgi:hypothetical protein